MALCYHRDEEANYIQSSPGRVTVVRGGDTWQGFFVFFFTLRYVPAFHCLVVWMTMCAVSQSFLAHFESSTLLVNTTPLKSIRPIPDLVDLEHIGNVTFLLFARPVRQHRLRRYLYQSHTAFP